MVRQEKKFTFQAAALNQVRDSLLTSKLGFVKVYDDRYVNSLYLDSFNFDNYQENLAGSASRSKVRARWYSSSPFTGLSDASELAVEIKLRKNIFGDKLISTIAMPENSSHLNGTELIRLFREQIPCDRLPHFDHCSEFTLGVAYLREYYEDRNGDLRVTIDSQIQFFKPSFYNTFDLTHVKLLSTDYSILECKFSPEFSGAAEDTLSVLAGVSVGRHSKYSVGLYLTQT